MNDRERFRRIMAYEPVDRPPVLALEPFEESAIARWRKEGLPENTRPEDFLGMSRLVHAPVNLGPIPAFEPKTVSEDAESYTEITWMGATVRRRRENPSLFYGHVDHPIKTRRDWEAYKERFKASSPGRIRKDLDAVARQLNASPHPVGVCLFPFFFRFGFYSMGMERFLTAFHEEPDLMHDIFAHLGDFVMRMVRPVLESVKLDFLMLAEDLAGKNGPLISPKTYEEFWSPYQDPVLRLFKQRGVPVVCQWSAGRFEELLPGMLGHGFNCTWPLEVMAGMEAPALRRRFGRALRLAGNIPKEAVIAGPAAIDKEIERLRPLIREGGFIPALDDMASPDMPFAHYRHMIEKLQGVRLG
jgi:uroporphyrinogen decarboxylase